MNVISFSLFGDNPVYWKGCLENIKLAKKHFADWEVWVHLDRTVPHGFSIQANHLKAKLIYCDNLPNPKLWRFLPLENKDVERFVVRDADGRIGEVDRACVDEWVTEGYDVHVMYDKPALGQPTFMPMMGGMCGFKNGKNIDKLKLPSVLEFQCADPYYYDEIFMRQHFLRSGLTFTVHDNDKWAHFWFPKSKPIPKVEGKTMTSNRVNVFSPRITCLTVYDPGFHAIGDLAYQRLQDYALCHNYRVECCRQPINLPDGRHSSWAKILAMKHELEKQNCDYVAWFDADSLVVNMRQNLEDIIVNDPELPIRVAQDDNGICCSHWIVKNCTFSRELLQAIWFMGDTSNHKRYHDSPKQEQDAFKALYHDFPGVQKHIGLIPKELVVHSGYIATGDEKFVVHFPSMPIDERTVVMRESMNKLKI